MKLLFVENRYKTFTFEKIGEFLQKEGHEIAFIIQNKNYNVNNSFKKYIIPYPKNKEKIIYDRCDGVERIISCDRMQNFFKKKGVEYFYYYDNEIKNILNDFKPDFVFGESTAFHELLVINNCKKNNVLYLNPCTCRYPKNRFSFYKYNTLEPYRGSNEYIENNKALDIVNKIISGDAKPDYMRVVKKERLKFLRDKVLKVKSYYQGDTFNTPNPNIKYKLEKQKQKNITSWDAIAKNNLDTKNNFFVLYPLQMQPEANIDVWGFKYRNQLDLIKKVTNILPENVFLIVKPNPKSKYELSTDLIDFIKNESKIITLNHQVTMKEILHDIDLVLTITGTIAIECILSNKPVVTLVKTLNNEQSNCKYIEDLFEIKSIINEVKENRFPRIEDQDKIKYINRLNASSYYGRVSDPFSNSKTFEIENINSVVSAFKDVIA